MRIYIISILIIVLVFLTYFSNFIFKKEYSSSEISLLKQENEDLRAQIQRSSTALVPQLSASNRYLKARVFSFYPFNIKNQITVDVGKEEGVKPLMPATIGENIFVGQVQGVFNHSSVIQTIFDPHLTLPVRVGEKGVDGLLQGGNEPNVSLIEKTKSIATGDFVYSASPEFPYALKIGEVSEVRESLGGIFKEAIVNTPFNVNELREVNILNREK